MKPWRAKAPSARRRRGAGLSPSRPRASATRRPNRCCRPASAIRRPAAARGAGAGTAAPPRRRPAPAAPPASAGARRRRWRSRTPRSRISRRWPSSDLPPPIEIPEGVAPPDRPGRAARPGNWGLGVDAFGSANGRFLSGLMRRLDAPLAVALDLDPAAPRLAVAGCRRRRGVNEVDWVAERAWLLLRMGEADGARMLVQAVDVDRFTPRMFTVAVQTALATADPAALCPLVGPGREALRRAGLAARRRDVRRARGRRRARQPADRPGAAAGAAAASTLLLAEKVIGAGTNTRRAVTIEWEGVDELNSWRFGLASATGLEIPGRADEPRRRRTSGPGRRARRWCRSSSASRRPSGRRRSASSPTPRWSRCTA